MITTENRLTIINPLFKDRVTFIKTAAETNGQVTEMELVLMPGGNNPLHYHKTYAERFTAIEGILGLRLKNKKLMLQSGESYTVAAGELHHFYNPTPQTIRCKVEFLPGHTGAENMLKIMYGLARDGKTDKKGVPRSIAALALISDMGDSNLPGFFTWISPLLKKTAAAARKKGLEKHLLDLYCRDKF